MEKRNYFDIHDKDVTPTIYHLLWAYVYPTPNDLIHEIYLESFDPEELCPDVRQEFNNRMSKLKGYCYTHQTLLDELIKKEPKPTLEEAIEEFKTWLTNHGVEEDSILVKMWW